MLSGYGLTSWTLLLLDSAGGSEEVMKREPLSVSVGSFILIRLKEIAI
jgi:hypothetical protein